MTIKTFTVWHFTSSSTNEQRVVAKVSEPGDRRAQHDFQRVLWQGNAESAEEAMALWEQSLHQCSGCGTDTNTDVAADRRMFEAQQVEADEQTAFRMG